MYLLYDVVSAYSVVLLFLFSNFFFIEAIDLLWPHAFQHYCNKLLTFGDVRAISKIFFWRTKTEGLSHAQLFFFIMCSCTFLCVVVVVVFVKNQMLGLKLWQKSFKWEERWFISEPLTLGDSLKALASAS